MGVAMPNPVDATTPSSSKSNVISSPTLVSGIVGGCIVLCVGFAAVVMYRRKKAKQDGGESGGMGDSDSFDSSNNKSSTLVGSSRSSVRDCGYGMREKENCKDVDILAPPPPLVAFPASTIGLSPMSVISSPESFAVTATGASHGSISQYFRFGAASRVNMEATAVSFPSFSSGRNSAFGSLGETTLAEEEEELVIGGLGAMPGKLAIDLLALERQQSMSMQSIRASRIKRMSTTRVNQLRLSAAGSEASNSETGRIWSILPRSSRRSRKLKGTSFTSNSRKSGQSSNGSYSWIIPRLQKTQSQTASSIYMNGLAHNMDQNIKFENYGEFRRGEELERKNTL
ncbi:UNVERIFIED_CONTAM: hypothetical protein HDU68_009586 [Siphonaria sp. JEL0065]|nr:hypothetical protein HDU68_009586 [Siphonaria sp. JEL0065]